MNKQSIGKNIPNIGSAEANQWLENIEIDEMQEERNDSETVPEPFPLLARFILKKIQAEIVAQLTGKPSGKYICKIQRSAKTVENGF